MPLTAEAFLDYRVGGLHLTRLEVEALRRGGELLSENQRERAEWEAKRQHLLPRGELSIRTQSDGDQEIDGEG